MKLINVIASLALIVAAQSTGACSKEEKKNEAPAPTAAAPTENAGTAAVGAEMGTKMAGKALDMAGQATVVAGEQAEAAGDMAEAAGEQAEAAGDSAARLPADFGDKVTAAMNDIIAAADATKGDCTKIVTGVAPVIAKHKDTFQAMSKTKDSKEAQAWVLANMAMMQKFQQAMMPIAMCAMKDPKVAEVLNQMK